MSLLVVVELAIKADCASEYAERLNRAFAETRAFDGCEGIEAYRNEDAPGAFLIVERWASRDHYRRYIEWRRSTGTFDRLDAISLRPMSVRYFTAVP